MTPLGVPRLSKIAHMQIYFAKGDSQTVPRNKPQPSVRMEYRRTRMESRLASTQFAGGM
jgi:hypothetical protein